MGTDIKLLIAVIAAAGIAPAAALAHGENPHAAAKIDYAKAEEQPFGRAADPKKAKRTVRIDMSDKMRFQPAEVRVKRGEVVRFVPHNSGQVLHEMVLGTMDELKQHAELMKKFPDMEHSEAHMAHVAPGKSGEIGWQFTRAGEFYYACLVPGHFEAGMVGKVIVTGGAAK